MLDLFGRHSTRSETSNHFLTRKGLFITVLSVCGENIERAQGPVHDGFTPDVASWLLRDKNGENGAGHQEPL